MIAPKQGRSGGGLFTTDGYVAGVCNFAEPRGNHGLYATPRSIYSVLDRNNLMALYAPVRGGSGTLLASRDRSRARGDSPITIARGQSPDAHEPERVAVHPGDVTVPEPEIVGIKLPLATRPISASDGGQGTTRRMAWHPTHAAPAPVAKLSTPEPAGKTEQTDLNLDPEADHDRFSHFESESADRGKEDQCRGHPVRLESPSPSRPRNRGGARALRRGECFLRERRHIEIRR